MPPWESVSRNRTRSGDLPAHCRALWRTHLGRIAARCGNQVFLHSAHFGQVRNVCCPNCIWEQGGIWVKTRLLLLIALIGIPVFGQVSVGIRIGPPPPPRVVRVVPRAPGPDYVWVEGYWYPVGNHY